MPESAELDILINTKAAGEGAKQTATSLKAAQTSAEKVNAGAKQATQSFAQMNNATKAVAASLMAIGSVAFVKMIQSANSYVQAVGVSESVSRQWLQAQYDIDDAQLKIGRDIATVMLPAYQEIAKLAGDIADFLDKHPDMTKLAVGGTAAVAGIATVYGAAKTYQIASALSALAAGGGAAAATAATAAGTGEAVTAAGTGAVAATVAKATLGKTILGGLLSPASAVLGGTVAGIAGADWMAKNPNSDITKAWMSLESPSAKTLANTIAGTPNNTNFLPATFGQTATIAAVGVGMDVGVLTHIIPAIKEYGFSIDAVKAAMAGGKETADQYALSVIGATGATNIPTTAPPGAGENPGPGGGAGPYYASQLMMQLGQQVAAEQQIRAYTIQTTYMKEDYDIQYGYAVKDNQLRIARATEDFNRTNLLATEDYQRTVKLSTRDFYISMARNQEDYQLSVSRNAEDHQLNMFQLALGGDAMSMWLAQRQYNISTKRAAEDQARQVSRSTDDFNKQQSDAADQLKIDQDRRAYEFALTEDRADADFQKQQDRTAAQYALQRTRLKEQFDEEARIRKESFILTILPTIYENDESLRQALLTFYGVSLKDLGAAITAAENGQYQLPALDIPNTQTPTPMPTTAPPTGMHWIWSNSEWVPSFASGGAVTQTGLIWAHAGETVLNPAVTDAAENAGRYGMSAQDTIIRLLAGGGSSKVYQDNRAFNAEVSAQTRKEIQNDTLMALAEAFN